MSNTRDAYCRSCRRFTYFINDGEDWQCQSCDSYNTDQNGGNFAKSTSYSDIGEDEDEEYDYHDKDDWLDDRKQFVEGCDNQYVKK